ncbi:hypothetical protein VR7878_03105 [Vibrio ruber DSM 16370]|uniref:Uncharacterized protein n=1 Tax=Vibrio ruber (strain DSM 16370 / JCM 11486 / BCRC 17186 / CECT 7878 / LMG 23124 / VR1) TaxID=1123498 RepID=A0A1R4LQZ3_VIBR1|nr:hypothetical protein [Vibrio ruber]SJN58898.1 hypothetical protein VR7878_03105 [Vibrio ruber DSM 16370]
MAICQFDLDNFNYNIESNLEAMGLPTPSTLWGSAITMTGVVTTIESALAAKASDIPLVTIARVSMRSKQVLGISSAYYVGAIIGSALMASKRATRCSADELKKAFSEFGLPSWAADDALRHNDNILRQN